MKTKKRPPKTKHSGKLTLKDRLSRLTHYRACQLLGPDGPQLIRQGAAFDNIDIDRDVYFRGDLFRLKLRGAGDGGQDAVATITAMARAKNRLRFNCTACQTVCEHIGAAVSLVLEEKTALGLAAAPDERRPLETLSEQELLDQALRDRRERARTEKFRLCSSDPTRPWTDYTVASALRARPIGWRCGAKSADSRICSCPDFRTNTLGTCKHIFYVLGSRAATFSGRGPQTLSQPRRLRPRALWRRSYAPCATPPPARPRNGQGTRAAGRWADRGRAAAGRLHGTAGSFGPRRYRLSRRRGIDPTPALRTAHVRSDGRDPQRPGPAPVAQAIAESRAAALSARRDRLCRSQSAGRSWPTTWAWARRSRAWARPSCSPARRASAACWWFAPPRSNRSGGTRSAVFPTARCSLSPAAPPSGPGNTTTTASSPSAITNRCCATSWPSSASAGT